MFAETVNTFCCFLFGGVRQCASCDICLIEMSGFVLVISSTAWNTPYVEMPVLNSCVVSR